MWEGLPAISVEGLPAGNVEGLPAGNVAGLPAGNVEGLSASHRRRSGYGAQEAGGLRSPTSWLCVVDPERACPELNRRGRRELAEGITGFMLSALVRFPDNGERTTIFTPSTI